MKLILASLLLLCWAPFMSAAEAVEPPAGSVHALLINGGDRPEVNYLSHLHHLEDMADLLRRRGVAPERIHIFSADGEEALADLARRDALPPDFWLIEGTGLANRLRPPAEFTDTRWAGVTLHPARLADLRGWFEAARTVIVPGDRLLLFVTDHGTADREEPDNVAISLWQEKLTVTELETLLGLLSPGVQVVLLMSQCYSGAFAELMYRRDAAEPSGGVCGFFSTTRERKAHGCYAEGRDRDRVGHAFSFIDALGRRATMAEAHVEVLVADDTPDVPLRTSDLYLARLVSAEAGARGMETDAFADSLLEKVWREGAAWEPEIKLLHDIGDAFGIGGPGSLGELGSQERDVDALAERVKADTDRWKTALVELKLSLQQTFVNARPEWRARLEPTVLRDLDSEQRAALLEHLLAELGRFAREQPQVWQKLELLHDCVTTGSEAIRRLEVRKAALLRVRTILVGMAGRALVAPGGTGRQASKETDEFSRQRQALERLEWCEALEPGTLPAPVGASPPGVRY